MISQMHIRVFAHFKKLYMKFTTDNGLAFTGRFKCMGQAQSLNLYNGINIS